MDPARPTETLTTGKETSELQPDPGIATRQGTQKKIAKRDVHTALQENDTGEASEYALVANMIDPADGKPEGRLRGKLESALPPRLRNLTQAARATYTLNKADSSQGPSTKGNSAIHLLSL